MEQQKQYNFKEAEERIRKFWDREKIYKFDQKSRKKIYSVDTPPPTVSGEMHIGHAFSYAQQDFIIRYKRMKGFNVFYPFGTDDNGLPTERLVEKRKGLKAREMPREDFIKVCLDFLKEERPAFIQDWKNIGISCDFNIIYSTIDTHSRKVSQWSFLDLHKKGRVYRKDAPAMWCPECKTGVAQVEVKDKEVDSTFNDIIFKVGKEDVLISTTRPELLPACVAVFYHPGDDRYKKYKGKKAKVPLFNLEVPILEDIRAEPEKGTGIVMCCTFGDQTDMEWQKAHNLEIRTAISKEGRMTDIAGKYKGMKVKEARKAITEELKKAKLLVNQKPIKHIVNCHERCGTEIEFVKSMQWFVKYLDLKDEMLNWGEQLKWHPEYMKHRYNNWVKGLQWDWLISNQRYFGVAFPVWYCKGCNEPIFAQEKQLPVEPSKDNPPVANCPKCGFAGFIPETDVLNTWFTSSMTPDISIQLMDKEIQNRLFPMDLRPQAHDIITFWLFNTLLKSRLHYGKNPWKETIISGFVTLEGQKMSKSKGNIIRPQEVIGRFGADAIRGWAASSKLGEDFDYQEKDIISAQRTITKLWNAARFCFMHIKEKPKNPKGIELMDKWVLAKLNEIVGECTKFFDEYEYSKAKGAVENFFWHEFCDNYLEIVKDRLYNAARKGKQSALFALYNSLFIMIRLFAPIMPFITEEIYQLYYAERENCKSIHISAWPKIAVKHNKKIEETGNLFVEILAKVRQEKAEHHKSLKAEIILNLEKEKLKLLHNVIDDLKAVCNAREINEGSFELRFL
ncbi:valine--tRNA ligase [archaeon]|nr:valine--tRNA ligase [archaeon]